VKASPAHEILKFLRRLATRGHADGADAAGHPDRLLTDGLLARRLIAGGRGRPFVLTDVGRSFLRRHLAGADGFAAQHQTRAAVLVEDESGRRSSVTVNLDESPLGRLKRYTGADGRPLIDAAEFAAGERLRSDYTRGAVMPRVTANWSASVADSRRDGGAGGIADLTATALAARQRVDRALDAVGPDFAGVLVDFCCFLKGIEEIERERRWPARSAKLLIRLALAALARHYGLVETAEGVGRPGTLRHWGSPDYRPTIDGG
jgi:hypothetical protein